MLSRESSDLEVTAVRDPATEHSTVMAVAKEEDFDERYQRLIEENEKLKQQITALETDNPRVVPAHTYVDEIQGLIEENEKLKERITALESTQWIAPPQPPPQSLQRSQADDQKKEDVFRILRATNPQFTENQLWLTFERLRPQFHGQTIDGTLRAMRFQAPTEEEQANVRRLFNTVVTAGPVKQLKVISNVTISLWDFLRLNPERKLADDYFPEEIVADSNSTTQGTRVRRSRRSWINDNVSVTPLTAFLTY
jgi:uncharacterized protein YdcH (DUF465 family)